jgi:hypothetical protein
MQREEVDQRSEEGWLRRATGQKGHTFDGPVVAARDDSKGIGIDAPDALD